MPIRRLLVLLALAACTDSSPRPTVAPSTTCETERYPCRPLTPSEDAMCRAQCGGEGYCVEYSTEAYAWCADHPGYLFGFGELCSMSGNPTWLTRCAPGVKP